MKNPKNILITGASSGIGEALASYYAGPDRTLYISGRNAPRLEAVRAGCAAKGADVHVRMLDVTDRVAMAQWIAESDDRTPLDLVIANAGISGGTGGADGSMSGETPAQARQIFDVNLGGVLNTIETACERMKRRGYGQIAIISSLAAYRGWPGAPAYSASKGAVRFYGEALRGALHGTGVQINVVCPGFIVSRMTAVNTFPMPFLMQAEKAAAIIARGLEKDRGRIAFPMPTHLAAWAVSVLPDAIMQNILRRLPKKTGF